jgi:uncharacterized protein
MQCPVCRVDLVMADRQGIEIDYCPKCRGVWLDRGELDKLIERSFNPPSQGHGGDYRPPPAYHPQAAHHGEHHKYPGHKRHKRGSILEEIFDFD